MYRILVFFLLMVPAFAEVPRVIVTIKPLHSLVASIMAGVGEPELLFNGKQSPHFAQLTTGQALAMQGADILVWVGPDYETTMVPKIKALDRIHVSLALQNEPGMRIHPTRHGGLWGSHDHDHHQPGHQHARDGHLWLDIRNAKSIVDAVTRRLVFTDPEHKADYQANARAVKDRLDKLMSDLKTKMIPAKGGRYIITHDCLQYIDRVYGSQGLGAILPNPELPASAEHLTNLQHQMESLFTAGYRICIFTEPQLPEALGEAMKNRTGQSPIKIDILGDEVPAGVNAYFEIMEKLTTTLAEELN